MPTAILAGGYLYTNGGSGYDEGANPNHGPEGGGTDVLIYRSAGGLTNTDTVEFGTGYFATMVTVVDDNMVTCRTPAHPADIVDIVLLDIDGNSVVSFPAGFTFEVESPYTFPTITSITPDTDVITGGASVVIIGTGFTPGMLVFFDDVVATDILYVSPTEYHCTVPPHELGVAKVSMRQTI
jgi:hypothetical protein